MPNELVSTDPADGSEIGHVPIANAEAVEAAVARARAAQAGWAERDVADRLGVLQRFKQDLLAAREEMAHLITRESGKPLPEARLADILPSLEMVTFLKRHGQDALSDERMRLDNPLLWDRTSRIEREPLGVVGVIAPWNYPLSIPATQLAQALFAGNAVVLKPSEHTPLVGQRLVEMLVEAGVPEDVVPVVQGPGEPTGKALVASQLDLLVFTGSVATGKLVSRELAPRLTPHVLELGGKDPMLVLEDANLALAARGAVWGAFTNAGQTCAAVERVYVHEDVAEAFVDRVVAETEALTVGPGLEAGSEVGPLIEDAAVQRCQAQLEDATKRGATVRTGGEPLQELGPRFFAPTVLTGVDHEMLVMQEETFGPLLPIATVGSQQEAVELANDTPFGLSASVWTGDKDRGERVARALQAGTVTVNDCVYTYAACETPWGGVKASGLGVTHGRWGLEKMTRAKHINTARGGRKSSPWYFPYDPDLDAMADEGLEFLYGSKLKGWSAAGPTLRRWVGKGRR